MTGRHGGALKRPRERSGIERTCLSRGWRNYVRASVFNETRAIREIGNVVPRGLEKDSSTRSRFKRGFFASLITINLILLFVPRFERDFNRAWLIVLFSPLVLSLETRGTGGG